MWHMNANMAPPSFPETFFAILVTLAFVTIIAVLVVMMLKPLFTQLQQSQDKTQPIPTGTVNLIYKDNRCIRIIEDEKQYKPGKGETIKSVSLQDRHMILGSHPCYTSDRIKISISACVIWGISDIREYVRGASQSEEGLRTCVQMAVLPALTHAMATSKHEQITGNLDEIMQKASWEANTWLGRYGLKLHKIAITHIEMPAPSPKSDAQKEADLIEALHNVIPKVDEKTLQHAQRIIELKLASVREATVKKD